jgi:hypothetical protein
MRLPQLRAFCAVSKAASPEAAAHAARRSGARRASAVGGASACRARDAPREEQTAAALPTGACARSAMAQHAAWSGTEV